MANLFNEFTNRYTYITEKNGSERNEADGDFYTLEIVREGEFHCSYLLI